MATNAELQTSADDNLKLLGNALGQKVGAELKRGNVTENADASAALATFKNSFNSPVGMLQNIPEDVYKGIAEAINGSADVKSIFTKFSSNEGELIKQVAKIVATLLPNIPDKKIPVKENDKTVYYTIKFNLASNGVFEISKGKESCTLTWKNQNTGKSAMAQYMVSLYNLEKSLSLPVLGSLGIAFAGKGYELFKLIKGDLTENAFFQALKKIAGNAVAKEVSKTKLHSVMSSLTNKTITSAVTNYENLLTAYDDLVKEINSASSTIDGIKTKSTAFTNAAKKVQSSLKALGVSVNLKTLPAPTLEPQYDKSKTAITLPAGYTNELKTSDYKSSVKTIDASNVTKSITVNGNSKANTIILGNGNNTAYGLGGKDVVFGADGNDKINGGDGNDLLCGGKGNDTLYGGKGTDSLLGEAGNDKLYGEDDDDTLYGGDGNDSIYGGNGNDSIYGNAGTDKLFGDAGNDTLQGGSGTDSLTGGDGADVFYYSNGDGTDTIIDYTTGVDKIYLASGSIDKVSISGKIVTFKIGKGSIKVKDAKDKEITVILPDNSEAKYLNGKLVSGDTPPTPGGGANGVTVTLSADTTGTFKLTEYNKTATKKAVNVDASAVKSYLYIYGDDKANTIWAPNKVYSGDSGGYIYAGAGNDTIYCGKGNDTIYYLTDGDSDTIYNFKTGDKIRINYGYAWSSKVKVQNVSLSGKDVIVNLDSGDKITLKDAKDQKIYIDGYYTDGKSVGTLTFSSNADMPSYDDSVDDVLSFADTANSDVGELDSLIDVLPTTSNSVSELWSSNAVTSGSLLRDAVFAQASDKK